MTEENNIISDINALIERKLPFAIYRIPGENTFRFVGQSEGKVRVLYDIKELNEQKGFVIAPFKVSPEYPIVLIEPDFEKAISITALCEAQEGQSLNSDEVLSECCTDTYSVCFDTFIQALRRKEFEKLVLSRKVVLEKDGEISPLQAFEIACRCYAYSYVYLCYTPQTGMWLGSTPEVILSGEKGEWNTVALAGTMSLQDGKLPQEWDDKNRKEQGYVASYIRQQLQSLGIQPSENGPYPVYAGALAHLKSDFRFSLADDSKLGDLLALLHPTPAVCGLPKEEAYRFILENEGYDRSYYSGFIGWVDPQQHTDLYVNLRCMNIGEDSLSLYAGGGLLASSDLNDEWLETEKKMQTMKRIAHLPILKY